jgi:hypothetical protein
VHDASPRSLPAATTPARVPGSVTPDKNAARALNTLTSPTTDPGKETDKETDGTRLPLKRAGKNASKKGDASDA